MEHNGKNTVPQLGDRDGLLSYTDGRDGLYAFPHLSDYPLVLTIVVPCAVARFTQLNCDSPSPGHQIYLKANLFGVAVWM